MLRYLNYGFWGRRIWISYSPNTDDQPFWSVIMTPKVTWHDIHGPMMIEQWNEYVIYMFESENHTAETVKMY